MCFRPSLLALAVTVLAAASVVATVDAAPSAATLTLDGVPFRPELALSSPARARGLMNRPQAPADGMLFVFPESTNGGFWMKNTHVPLTIVFFDADGKRVRRLSMKPCHEDPCAIYNPGRRYRFALELRAADVRPARKIGPVNELRRLVRRAS